MFVWAGVLCGASPVAHAGMGNDETLQKIHCKKPGRPKVRHMRPTFGESWKTRDFCKNSACKVIQISIADGRFHGDSCCGKFCSYTSNLCRVGAIFS